LRGPAAETIVSNKNTNEMQRSDTECTSDSVYLDTCLGSEIDPLNLVEARLKAFVTSSESSISFSSAIHYWNRSSGEEYHQRRSNDPLVIESTFSIGDWFGIFRAEKLDSDCDVHYLKYMIWSSRLSKDNSRNVEYHLSTGWLVYSKRSLFSVDGSCRFGSNRESFESYPSGIKSNPTKSS
jgi:hypothetical protein